MQKLLKKTLILTGCLVYLTGLQTSFAAGCFNYDWYAADRIFPEDDPSADWDFFLGAGAPAPTFSPAGPDPDLLVVNFSIGQSISWDWDNICLPFEDDPADYFSFYFRAQMFSSSSVIDAREALSVVVRLNDDDDATAALQIGTDRFFLQSAPGTRGATIDDFSAFSGAPDSGFHDYEIRIYDEVIGGANSVEVFYDGVSVLLGDVFTLSSTTNPFLNIGQSSGLSFGSFAIDSMVHNASPFPTILIPEPSKSLLILLASAVAIFRRKR